MQRRNYSLIIANQPLRYALVITFGFLLVAVQSVSADDETNSVSVSQSERVSERSIELFNEAAKVFRHPRCLNCHPGGDAPTQGDDLHAHVMNVQRGPADHGNVGMRCATCHTDANFEAAGVPGAPKWGLAPRSMAWQGKTNREICLAIKNPKTNNGKTLEQLIEHNAHDKLVAWGWKPGSDREPVPGTQEEFGRIFADWVQTGAVCPPQ